MNITVSPARDQRVLQIMRAIAGDDFSSPKSAACAALEIEEQFLMNGWPIGEVVASVEDIRKRLKLGRWACREALGILQMRGSAYMRRGPGGGVVVSASTFERLVYSLYVHLVLTGVTVHQVFQARNAAYATAARMCIDARLPAERFTDLTSSEAQSLPLRLAALLENPVAIFFVQLLETLAALATGAGDISMGMRQGARVASLEHECGLIQAVVEGDTARAATLAAKFPAPGTDDTTKQLELMPPPNQRGGGGDVGYAGQLAAMVARDMSKPQASERIGTERDIAERYGFNHEIVRQAIRILEGVGLVHSRRGRGGGLLRQKPHPGSLIRQIFSHLVSLKVTGDQNRALHWPLICEAGVAAAQNELTCRPVSEAEWMTSFEHSETMQGTRQLAQIEYRMQNALFNPVLALCMQALGFHHLWCISRGTDTRTLGPELGAQLGAEYRAATRDVYAAIAARNVTAVCAASQAKLSVFDRLLAQI